MKGTIFVSNTSSINEQMAYKVLASSRLYGLPLANCNRCLVVRILQDKHLGLEEEPDQRTCLGLWKNYLPTRFEAYRKD